MSLWTKIQINVPQNTNLKKFLNIKAKEAASKIYLKLPETSKKKVRGFEYKDFIRPYRNTSIFSAHDINLIFSLRSKRYPAKRNFKKFHRGDLKCIFKCDKVKKIKIYFTFFRSVYQYKGH